MALGRTIAETEELELGRSLADFLIPIRKQKAVAVRLGISASAVKRIERRALAKVAKAMKAYCASAEYQEELPEGPRTLKRTISRRPGFVVIL